MQDNKQKIYQTESLELSSYLLSKDCQLMDIKPVNDNDKKLVFCFLQTSRLQTLVGNYFALRASVSPQGYENARRTLKGIVYARKGK